MNIGRWPAWAQLAVAVVAVVLGFMGLFNSVHVLAKIIWAVLVVLGVLIAAAAWRRRGRRESENPR